MKIIHFLIVLIFILSSCWIYQENIPEKESNIDESNVDEQNGDTNMQWWYEEVQEPLRNITQTWSDMSAFLENNTEDTISLSHESGKASQISFINDTQPATLHVQITFPEWDGNLRLSQIIMPDGTTDGPFDTNTTYELTQVWGYQLIFNENLMSWSPWSGVSIVQLSKN